jgi:hypothetical protein
VLASETVEGTVRVQFDRGWASVAAASGKVLLEVVEDEVTGGSQTSMDAVPGPEENVGADIAEAAAISLQGTSTEEEGDEDADLEAMAAELETESNLGAGDDMNLDAMAAELAIDTGSKGDVGEKSPDLDAIENELEALATSDDDSDSSGGGESGGASASASESESQNDDGDDSGEVEADKETESSAQAAHSAEAPVRYRAVAKGVIRERADKASPKCGELALGDEIVVLASETVEGTVRVQFDRGWASVAAASGKVLLEVVEDEVTGGSEAEPARYKAVAPGVIRKAADMDSDKVGKLEQGEIVEVTETEKTASGTTRVHFDRGWASVSAANGKLLLEKLS